MSNRKYDHMLAAALMLGTAILGLCAGQADVMLRKPTPMVQCSVENDDSGFELQFPGDISADGLRDLLVCGADATADIARVAGPAGTPPDPTAPDSAVLSQ